VAYNPLSFLNNNSPVGIAATINAPGGEGTWVIVGDTASFYPPSGGGGGDLIIIDNGTPYEVAQLNLGANLGGTDAGGVFTLNAANGVDFSGTLYPNLVAGTNISLVGSGQNLTISASGSTVVSGITEMIFGTLTATGAATLGSGLSMSGSLNPTIGNAGVLNFGGATGIIALGSNLSMTGQTLNVAEPAPGITEMVFGTLTATGAATVGAGLLLAGASNPTLSNSGVLGLAVGTASGAGTIAITGAGGITPLLSGGTLSLTGTLLEAIEGATTISNVNALAAGTNVSLGGTTGGTVTINCTATGSITYSGSAYSTLIAGPDVVLTPGTAGLSIGTSPTLLSATTVSAATLTASGTIELSGTALFSAAEGIVAAGTAQAGSTTLGALFNVVTSSSSTGFCITLPPSVPVGVPCEVVNRGAVGLSVYPPVGSSQIENLGTGVPVGVDVNGSARFVPTGATQWRVP
jgi:hypothetical protein